MGEGVGEVFDVAFSIDIIHAGNLCFYNTGNTCITDAKNKSRYGVIFLEMA